jgi:hypothetical protein
MPASLEVIEALRHHEGLLLMEPRSQFDKCVVGLGFRFSDAFVVYDQKCVLDAIASDITDDEDEDSMVSALEHFSFNILGSWVGEATPAFILTEPEDI